jgi:hypothetical protein
VVLPVQPSVPAFYMGDSFSDICVGCSRCARPAPARRGRGRVTILSFYFHSRVTWLCFDRSSEIICFYGAGNFAGERESG